MTDSPTYESDEIDEPQIYELGVQLFNEGDWFEAHEVWEDIWRLASDEKKRFYQGLIQCAVTIEHLRRGNPRGARSVYKSAQTKFTDLPQVYMGIDIHQLLADMKKTMDPVLALPAERFAPGLPHGQDLPFNPQNAPKIHLNTDPFAA